LKVVAGRLAGSYFLGEAASLLQRQIRPLPPEGDAIGRLRRTTAIEDGAQGDTRPQDHDWYEESAVKLRAL
jgi:hypothetical protein